jgi:hypothetical protein
VIYQDPLGYLLGLEGIALLDAWAGDHDRAFTEARLAEVRRLLADEQLRDRGVQVEQVSAAAVYGQISVGYDADAGGGLFATDEPVVAEYLAGRESGVARAPRHRCRQLTGRALLRAATCPRGRVSRRRA